MIRILTTRRSAAVLMVAVACGSVGLTSRGASAVADAGFTPARMVVQWDYNLLDALTLAHTPAPAAMRAGAIVATSVYDAVDGITGRYALYHLPAPRPHGVSAQAAAAGAAHQALVALFPDQQATLDQLLSWSLASLVADDGDIAAIDRGANYGSSVATAILNLRADDGFTSPLPPYSISPLIGRWQPTAPAFASAPSFRQFADMTPWALTSPGQFLPPAPPALTSARYARDLNEVKTVGSADSTERSPTETQTALFWNSAPPVVLWDPVADTLITDRHLDVADAARILALENMAMADAVIAVWNAKNYYDTWRPITAIQDAALDGNASTQVDAAWQPLLTTPTFQEYPSGHSGVSQAAAAILADQFGDATPYTLTSPGMPGVTRSLPSFSAGVDQVTDARVLGGIHFRFACDAATALGRAVAGYVEETQMQPRN